jgi:hypothetical protein
VEQCCGVALPHTQVDRVLINHHQSYKDFVSRNPDKTRFPAGFKYIKSKKVLNDPNTSNITDISDILETPARKKTKKKKTSCAAGAKDEDEEATDSD